MSGLTEGRIGCEGRLGVAGSDDAAAGADLDGAAAALLVGLLPIDGGGKGARRAVAYAADLNKN